MTLLADLLLLASSLLTCITVVLIAAGRVSPGVSWALCSIAFGLAVGSFAMRHRR